MVRPILGLLFFLFTTLFITSCQKKDWDEYYGRPDDLAPPIYKQLEARGNFKHFLSVIDKSGYKNILGNAGSWTLFAPNDEAFEKYFKEKGISGVEEISQEEARKLSLFNLVYNAYRKDQLSNWQSGSIDTNSAFRRKTAYYDFVYKVDGKAVVDNGRNGLVNVATDNNNKHIPYFTEGFFSKNGLSAADYTALYPGKTFSGFQVDGATVINADIPAENGIIHEVDKVIEALPSIDQYIASKPEYSEFKKLLDRFAVYIASPAYTERYKALTGSADSVFIKYYQPTLAFSPNNESVTGHTSGQGMSYSIAVPTNTELLAYTSKILRYYHTFNDAPISVLIALLNSHMWTEPLWPSKLSDTENSMGESATFNPANVVEKKTLSNGFFYGINAPQEANVFRTVFGEAFLNPQYNLMTLALQNDLSLFEYVTAPNVKISLLLMPDTDYASEGLSYNTTTSQWGYQAPGATIDYSSAATVRVNRFTQTSLLVSPVSAADFNGVGVVEGFNGEYIRYENGRLQASGNAADKSYVTVTEERKTVNGNAFVLSGRLKTAPDTYTVGVTLGELANSTDANVKNQFSHFYNFLINSSLWVDASKSIFGINTGSFTTIFAPSNAAIEAAVRAGRLPGNPATGVPEFNPEKQNQQSATLKGNVEAMLKYAMLTMPVGSSVAIDGKKSGNFTTLLRDSENNAQIVTVFYPSSDPRSAEIVDNKPNNPNVARVNYEYSNYLSNRALIHSIDSVLGIN